MENIFPYTHSLNDFQLVFNECLTEIENQSDITFDVNLVGNFLINSWFKSFFRVKSNDGINPIEDFRAFTLRQLLN